MIKGGKGWVVCGGGSSGSDLSIWLIRIWVSSPGRGSSFVDDVDGGGRWEWDPNHGVRGERLFKEG